jgi:hypothetical protein
MPPPNRYRFDGAVAKPAKGEVTTGNNKRSWISFLGGGCIEGCLEIMGDLGFEGYKVEGGWVHT